VGENAAFGADGFGDAAVAGVVQSGGQPVYTALEEWLAGEFVNGSRQVGAPQGGWELAINEEAIAANASPTPLLNDTAMELLQNATQSYVDSGDEEALNDLKRRAMTGNAQGPDGHEFSCVVVQAA
jgi:basic membrane lipoprotein Med (substrate-binding protein (PBP1-ABC) superfamily)